LVHNRYHGVAYTPPHGTEGLQAISDDELEDISLISRADHQVMEERLKIGVVSTVAGYGTVEDQRFDGAPTYMVKVESLFEDAYAAPPLPPTRTRPNNIHI